MMVLCCQRPEHPLSHLERAATAAVIPAAFAIAEGMGYCMPPSQQSPAKPSDATMMKWGAQQNAFGQ